MCIRDSPWGERHHYVLPIGKDLVNESVQKEVLGKGLYQYSFDKAFHVSPFNPMNMVYRWVLSLPENRLHVHMENRLKKCSYADEGHVSDSDVVEDLDEKHFDATLILERKEFHKEFSKILIQYPFITVKVMTGIYWQAFRLWLKRMPFYDHPNLEK